MSSPPDSPWAGLGTRATRAASNEVPRMGTVASSDTRRREGRGDAGDPQCGSSERSGERPAESFPPTSPAFWPGRRIEGQPALPLGSASECLCGSGDADRSGGAACPLHQATFPWPMTTLRPACQVGTARSSDDRTDLRPQLFSCTHVVDSILGCSRVDPTGWTWSPR